MFATFTDWTSDEPKAFAERAHELWPSMKEAGAVNMRIVQTSDKGAHYDRRPSLRKCKQDAIDALSAWGATFHSHHAGYNREIVGPR